MTTYLHYRSQGLLDSVHRKTVGTVRQGHGARPQEVTQHSVVSKLTGFRKGKSKIAVVRSQTVADAARSSSRKRDWTRDTSQVAIAVAGRHTMSYAGAVDIESSLSRHDSKSLAWQEKASAGTYSGVEPLGLEALREMITDIFERKMKDFLGAYTGQTSATPASAPSPAPLAAARARGESYMKSQLDAPENINLESAAAYSGFSGRHINELRQKGDVYALVLDGNTRGYRYPQWQFDAERERLVPVLQRMKAKNLGCWAMHHFMLRSNDDLGRSPKDAVLDPEFPISLVEQAVDRRFSEADQGAS